MDYITIIGLVAGALTTASFIPQIFKIYRTKKTRDISLLMYAVLCLGILLWVVYGILAKSLPVIAANSAVLVLCAYIIATKIKYG